MCNKSYCSICIQNCTKHQSCYKSQMKYILSIEHKNTTHIYNLWNVRHPVPFDPHSQLNPLTAQVVIPILINIWMICQAYVTVREIMWVELSADPVIIIVSCPSCFALMSHFCSIETSRATKRGQDTFLLSIVLSLCFLPLHCSSCSWVWSVCAVCVCVCVCVVRGTDGWTVTRILIQNMRRRKLERKGFCCKFRIIDLSLKENISHWHIHEVLCLNSF